MRIAIVGKTNVGKSSLLNALLRRDRAIVSDIPGTTRDTLTEWMEIAGFPVLVTDTAGLRNNSDKLELLGQKRTKSEIEQADLVLFMVDVSDDITEEDVSIYRQIEKKPHLIIVNKIDLKAPADIDLKKLRCNADVLYTSCLRGDGLEELSGTVADLLHLEDFDLDSAILSTERQFDAASRAGRVLREMLSELDKDISAEIVAVFLRETIDYLGELVGQTTSEDIINRIFDRFCIGK